jgi:hypothetical protein
VERELEDDLTFRKYRSSTVLLRSKVPARKTSTMHTSTAKVRRKGAAMQQIRPALTIVRGLEEEFSQRSEMSVVFNSVQFSSAEMFGEERFQVRGTEYERPRSCSTSKAALQNEGIR